MCMGLPFPKGLLRDVKSLGLMTEDGQGIPLQGEARATWDDGSLKWVLLNFQADLAGEKEKFLILEAADKPVALKEDQGIEITENEKTIGVDTGLIKFNVRKDKFSLIDELWLDESGKKDYSAKNRMVEHNKGQDAYLGVEERPYGWEGDYRASYGEEFYKTELEESGPLRAVIRLEGWYEEYERRRQGKYVTRIYAYYGKSYLKIAHTVIFTGDPAEQTYREISLKLPVKNGGKKNYAFGMEEVVSGEIEKGEVIYLIQADESHARLYYPGYGPRHNEFPAAAQYTPSHHMGPVNRCEKSQGWMDFNDGRRGVAVVVPKMWQEHPKELLIDGRNDTIGVYIYPAHMETYGYGINLDLKPKGIYFEGWYTGRVNEFLPRTPRPTGETLPSWYYPDKPTGRGVGVGKTTEFYCYFHGGGWQEAEVAGWAEERKINIVPLAQLDWYAQSNVLGNYQPLGCGNKSRPDYEEISHGVMDWLKRHIKMNNWYGMFDYGDVKVNWDLYNECWADIGREGWLNNEHFFLHGLFMYFLSTGDIEIFDFADAMAKHLRDVDYCHYEPFRHLDVGSTYRHNPGHWGRPSGHGHIFVKGLIDHYYLTGDKRDLEVLKETGEYSLRDLRGTMPTDRGRATLLQTAIILYDVLKDERFLKLADKAFRMCLLDEQKEKPGSFWFYPQSLEAKEGDEFYEYEQRVKRWIKDSKDPEKAARKEADFFARYYLLYAFIDYHRITQKEEAKKLFLRTLEFTLRELAGERTSEGTIPELLSDLKDTYFAIPVLFYSAYAYDLTGEKKYRDVIEQVVRIVWKNVDKSDDDFYRGNLGGAENHSYFVGWVPQAIPYITRALQ